MFGVGTSRQCAAATHAYHDRSEEFLSVPADDPTHTLHCSENFSQHRFPTITM